MLSVGSLVWSWTCDWYWLKLLPGRSSFCSSVVAFISLLCVLESILRHNYGCFILKMCINTHILFIVQFWQVHTKNSLKFSGWILLCGFTKPRLVMNNEHKCKTVVTQKSLSHPESSSGGSSISGGNMSKWLWSRGPFS